MRYGSLLLLIPLLVACSSGGGTAQKEDAVNIDTPQWRQDAPAGVDSSGRQDAGAQDGNGNLPPGYEEFCITDADCADWGLECFSLGPDDPTPICSSPCQTAADCPGNLICKKKGDDLVCQPADYCDECSTDAQCGESMQCLTDHENKNFCSRKCSINELGSCPAGHVCRQIGTGIEEYYCFPQFGSCRGDGTHCAPCQSDADCLKGLVCHENDMTHESYCATKCNTDMDCAKGFGCHEIAGEPFQLCTLEVEGVPVETCYKGNKQFCEPCLNDYECESDVCYSYPTESRYHCSFACDEDAWPDNEGCPPGLFCVPNHGASATAETCVPPGAWGCQGFLNCLGVDCPQGEKCVSGFCEPK